jgi:hypothetical protein
MCFGTALELLDRMGQAIPTVCGDHGVCVFYPLTARRLRSLCLENGSTHHMIELPLFRVTCVIGSEQGDEELMQGRADDQARNACEHGAEQRA